MERREDEASIRVAVIRKQKAEIEKLEEKIKALESQIQYLSFERWEPLCSARLFDAKLPRASEDRRSGIRALTGLRASELQHLINDQQFLLKTAGKEPVSPEDIYLYLMYLRTGLSAMQLQVMYQSSTSHLNSRYSNRE